MSSLRVLENEFSKIIPGYDLGALQCKRGDHMDKREKERGQSSAL